MTEIVQSCDILLLVVLHDATIVMYSSSYHHDSWTAAEQFGNKPLSCMEVIIVKPGPLVS